MLECLNNGCLAPKQCYRGRGQRNNYYMYAPQNDGNRGGQTEEQGMSRHVLQNSGEPKQWGTEIWERDRGRVRAGSMFLVFLINLTWSLNYSFPAQITVQASIQYGTYSEGIKYGIYIHVYIYVLRVPEYANWTPPQAMHFRHSVIWSGTVLHYVISFHLLEAIL